MSWRYSNRTYNNLDKNSTYNNKESYINSFQNIYKNFILKSINFELITNLRILLFESFFKQASSFNNTTSTTYLNNIFQHKREN